MKYLELNILLFSILCPLTNQAINSEVKFQIEKKTIFVTFLGDFDETLRVYVNRKILISDRFQTNPSTGSCLNTFSAQILKNSQNVITVKDKNDKLLYEFGIPWSAREKYLYIRRVSKKWSFVFESEPIALE